MKLDSTARIVASALLGALFAAPAMSGSGPQGQNRVDGTWSVRLTPADCATGTPAPPFAFDSYLTLGSDGTLIETTSNPNFLPGQRSAGHGHWQRVAHGTYDAVFQAFIQFDSAARVRGTQRVETTFVMIDADHWHGSADITFRNAAGTEYFTGCAIADAVRLP